MENMVTIAEDIIEQPVVSVLTNYREIFLVGGQAATTFKAVDDPLSFIYQILGQETIPSWGGICWPRYGGCPSHIPKSSLGETMSFKCAQGIARLSNPGDYVINMFIK